MTISWRSIQRSIIQPFFSLRSLNVVRVQKNYLTKFGISTVCAFIWLSELRSFSSRPTLLERVVPSEKEKSISIKKDSSIVNTLWKKHVELTDSASSTNGKKNITDKDDGEQDSSPGESSISTILEMRYRRMTQNIMAFATGSKQSQDNAFKDLLPSVMAKNDGDVDDTKSFMAILNLFQQQILGDLGNTCSSELSEELQRLADKFIGDIDFNFSALPTSLFFYLEHEDEVKNPSWKRRAHRFFPGIAIDQVNHLHSCMKLAEIAYLDTENEISTELEERGYELLHCNLTSSPGKPAFYIAVQRRQSSEELHWASSLPVVIGVRGTKTVADAITDLLCDSTDYRGGKAHAYILMSGKNLVEEQLPLLRDLSQSSGKTMQITFVGHSLGAGAATIAGLDLALDHGYNVQVVGFGCPALLSSDLAQQFSKYVTTVINDSDVVPRMSGATISNLLRDVSEFNWLPYIKKDLQQAIEEFFPKTIANSVLEAVEASLESYVRSTIPKSKNSEKVEHSRLVPELFPPGRCMHFYSDGSGISAAVVPSDFFDKIDVSRRMIDDHTFFAGYERMMLTVMRDYTLDHNFRFEIDE